MLQSSIHRLHHHCYRHHHHYHDHYNNVSLYLLVSVYCFVSISLQHSRPLSLSLSLLLYPSSLLLCAHGTCCHTHTHTFIHCLWQCHSNFGQRTYIHTAHLCRKLLLWLANNPRFALKRQFVNSSVCLGICECLRNARVCSCLLLFWNSFCFVELSTAVNCTKCTRVLISSIDMLMPYESHWGPANS